MDNLSHHYTGLEGMLRAIGRAIPKATQDGINWLSSKTKLARAGLYLASAVVLTSPITLGIGLEKYHEFYATNQQVPIEYESSSLYLENQHLKVKTSFESTDPTKSVLGSLTAYTFSNVPTRIAIPLLFNRDRSNPEVRKLENYLSSQPSTLTVLLPEKELKTIEEVMKSAREGESVQVFGSYGGSLDYYAVLNRQGGRDVLAWDTTDKAQEESGSWINESLLYDLKSNKIARGVYSKQNELLRVESPAEQTVPLPPVYKNNLDNYFRGLK